MAQTFDFGAICPLTTQDALRRAALLAGDIEAIVAEDGRLTYLELDQAVARIRAALVAADIQRGDHVAICLGNSSRWISLFLAIGSLGAVTVPVNTRFRRDEFAHVLRHSRSKLLFAADRFLKVDFAAMLRSVCPAVEGALPDANLPDLKHVVVIGNDIPSAADSWETFIARGSTTVPAVCSADDILLIQYTSGTTAYPKGVLLTHRSMCANAFVCGVRLGVRSGDRFHSARPFFHVAGTTLSILLAIQHLITLVTMERFDPAAALELIERERCTHFSGNDTIALMLLNQPERARHRLALRGAWLAASPTILRRVANELGARECVAAYGLSEASPNVAQGCWWEPDDIRFSCKLDIQPGVEVRICEPGTEIELAAGTDGEIHVRGWNVMQGYHRMPEETHAALNADGWLSTGDLGRLHPDGRLEFVGRAKEIIRVGGENVAPIDIEDILHQHPQIRQAVVVGVPDKRLIEVPFAFVVLNDGQTAQPNELLTWARQHMASFKVPKHLQIIQNFDDIGITASSKVQKKQLAAHAERLLTTRP